MKKRCKNKIWFVFVAVILMGWLSLYFLQTYWAHRNYKNPTDEVYCEHLLGWFTMEDRLVGKRHRLKDVQPGDILLTLSTHSMGWRHGHAGLVIDENTTLECVTWGEVSCLCNLRHWETYSNVALLRIKDVTQEQQQAVVAFALEHLVGVEYRLFAGFLGEKAPAPKEERFGLQCSYLVWYAWYQMGYDTDSDGGRLVSAYDILHADCVEVIEIYGMDEERIPFQ